MNDEQQKVFLVCTDDETANNVGDCLKRTAAALSAVDIFFDATCQLDEDAADFEEKFTPIYTRFVMTMMALYPNSEQIVADAKTFGDFTVRKIDTGRKQ